MTYAHWAGLYFLLGFVGFLIMVFFSFKSDNRESDRRDWNIALGIAVVMGFLWLIAVYFWVFGDNPEEDEDI